MIDIIRSPARMSWLVQHVPTDAIARMEEDVTKRGKFLGMSALAIKCTIDRERRKLITTLSPEPTRKQALSLASRCAEAYSVPLSRRVQKWMELANHGA